MAPRRRDYVPLNPMTSEQRQLYEQCIPLAYSIAFKFMKRGPLWKRLGSEEDVKQEALFSLGIMTQKYKPSKGAFTTYVTQYLEHALVDATTRSGIINLPRNFHSRKKNRYLVQGRQAMGVTQLPTTQTEGRASKKQRGIKQEEPIDLQLPDRCREMWIDEGVYSELQVALEKLTERERYIIQECILNGRFQAEVAKSLGYHRHTISDIQRQAIANLRLAMTG